MPALKKTPPHSHIKHKLYKILISPTLTYLILALILPIVSAQPNATRSTPITTAWAALAFLTLSCRQFAVRLIRRESSLVSVINWHFVQLLLLLITILIVAGGVITAWSLQWATSDVSVLVSVMGSVLLALSLDGKWQFRHYEEYRIARAIARGDRYRVGSRVDEETTEHKEIYLRTLYGDVQHEKESLGQWGGAVYRVKNEGEWRDQGNGWDKLDDEERARRKVVWLYVIKDEDWGHRTAAGQWLRTPPLSSPGGPLHWVIIHARLLLAWVPEHVSKKKLLSYLIANVREMQNFTAAIQTWKGLEAFGRLPKGIESLKVEDLEGFVSILLLEYPRAIKSVVTFVRDGWKELSKEELLDEKTVILEFIKALCGLANGGWESGLELRSDPHCLPGKKSDGSGDENESDSEGSTPVDSGDITPSESDNSKAKVKDSGDKSRDKKVSRGEARNSPISREKLDGSKEKRRRASSKDDGGNSDEDSKHENAKNDASCLPEKGAVKPEDSKDDKTNSSREKRHNNSTNDSEEDSDENKAHYLPGKGNVKQKRTDGKQTSSSKAERRDNPEEDSEDEDVKNNASCLPEKGAVKPDDPDEVSHDNSEDESEERVRTNPRFLPGRDTYKHSNSSDSSVGRVPDDENDESSKEDHKNSDSSGTSGGRAPDEDDEESLKGDNEYSNSSGASGRRSPGDENEESSEEDLGSSAPDSSTQVSSSREGGSKSNDSRQGSSRTLPSWKSSKNLEPPKPHDESAESPDVAGMHGTGI